MRGEQTNQACHQIPDTGNSGRGLALLAEAAAAGSRHPGSASWLVLFIRHKRGSSPALSLPAARENLGRPRNGQLVRAASCRLGRPGLRAGPRPGPGGGERPGLRVGGEGAREETEAAGAGDPGSPAREGSPLEHGASPPHWCRRTRVQAREQLSVPAAALTPGPETQGRGVDPAPRPPAPRLSPSLLSPPPASPPGAGVYPQSLASRATWRRGGFCAAPAFCRLRSLPPTD